MSRLLNKRVVITRPKAQAGSFADKLAQLGAEAILLPVIEIRPMADFRQLDSALQRLDDYDWLVLTSVNSVRVVFDRLFELGIQQFPLTLKTACIGPKTAAAFEERGYKPDFIPETYVAEAVMPGLMPIYCKKVLLPQADIARKFLLEAIRESGGFVDAITAYQTLPSEPSQDSLAALRDGVDVVTFTSPSTVLNFAAVIEDAGLDIQSLPGDPIFACIGPITAQALEEIGLPVTVMPGEYTVDGMLDALKDHFYSGEKNLK